MTTKRSCGVLALPCWLTLVMASSCWGQMITGHRGASHDAPENTLAAFQLAWEQGADAVEGDFYLTKDRQIVCMHDADTLRTTGVKKIIARSTLEDLRSLDAGRWKGEAFSGERIPTIAEVLAVIPEGKRLVIELKTDPVIVPVLAEELKKFSPNPASLQMIAFDADTVAACKRQFPEIECHWLTSFKRSNPIGPWRPTAAEIAQTIHRTRADGVGLKGIRNRVNADFIRDLKAKGVKDFHVWTIDSVEDARYFRNLGAIGITTNRPNLIRQGLLKAE